MNEDVAYARNTESGCKRMLQVVDNAVFWQNVLLYFDFENDHSVRVFRRFLLWSRGIPNMGVARNI